MNENLKEFNFDQLIKMHEEADSKSQRIVVDEIYDRYGIRLQSTTSLKNMFFGGVVIGLIIGILIRSI
jgi:hypothetical protein